MEALDRKGENSIFRSTDTAILSYSTNHFGHFVAETLGSIIHYSRILRAKTVVGNLGFAVLTPSSQWFHFLQELCPGTHFFNLNEYQFLEAEVIFEQAVVLPTLSPWQNLVLARNFLQRHFSIISPDPQHPRLIYLYSPDQHRVSNEALLQDWLDSRGFVSVDPCQINPNELMLRLRDAELVISTQGSIVMNLLLARTAPTIVLGWCPPLLSSRQFSGGGVFNAVAHGLWHELPCRPIGLTTSAIQHPFSVPIEVPVTELEQLVVSLIGF